MTPIPPRSLPHDVSTGRDDEPCAHRHGNGHFTLRHRIHWTTEKRGFEDDVAGDAGVRLNITCREIDLSWQEQEIIVGQPAVKGRVHELVDREPIAAGIEFEVFEGCGGVECHVGGQIKPGL